MLFDNETALRELFAKSSLPITAHCEDEQIIRKNSDIYREKYGEDVPVKMHPLIRSREACLRSSSHAVNLAKEYNTRLHILHLSTADELKLFGNELPLDQKRITGEVCVHHHDEAGQVSHDAVRTSQNGRAHRKQFPFPDQNYRGHEDK